jgi:hypothetical protein
VLQHTSTVFAGAKEGPKHHYIPVFYLKRWAGADGLLCEYSRPHNDVKVLRKSPKATGYVRGLYNIPGLPPKLAGQLETRFLSLADDWAARAHQVLLSSDRSIDFPDLRTKAGWARFVYSLVLRTPEYLAQHQQRFIENAADVVDSIKDDYENLRKETDPPTFEEFRAKFLANPANTSIHRYLHRLIDSETVILRICEMRWFTVWVDDSPFPLLTSDRPVIMTNGLQRHDSHIVVPLSPRQLFVAVNTENMARKLRFMKPREMVRRANERVAECAIRYVYGVDDRQLLFVSRRLGKREKSSPIE